MGEPEQGGVVEDPFHAECHGHDVVLGHETDPVLDVLKLPLDIVAAQVHGPPVWRSESGEGVQESGLAASRGSEHADKLPGKGGELDVVEYLTPPSRHADISSQQVDRFGSWRPFRRNRRRYTVQRQRFLLPAGASWVESLLGIGWRVKARAGPPGRGMGVGLYQGAVNGARTAPRPKMSPLGPPRRSSSEDVAREEAWVSVCIRAP